jgi:hypothetical protein
MQHLRVAFPSIRLEKPLVERVKRRMDIHVVRRIGHWLLTEMLDSARVRR